MDKQVIRDYMRFKADGAYCTPPGRAMCALESARLLVEWRRCERAGLVRIKAEPELENYFSVYGEPGAYVNGYGRRVTAEQAREEIVRQLDRDGCWYVYAQYKVDSDEWQDADGVGMCVGYNDPCDPFENCYVIDMMRDALGKLSFEVTP